MPRRDQTGPMSEGSKTGKGLGPCGEANAEGTGNRNDQRNTRGIVEDKSAKVEFGLRQGSGVKRRRRGSVATEERDTRLERTGRRGRRQ